MAKYPFPTPEVIDAIEAAFKEEDRWDALEICRLESGFNTLAINDTTDAEHPCSTPIGFRGDRTIYAEISVGLFQINLCVHPELGDIMTLLDPEMNAAAAAQLFYAVGSWSPWYFSALELGLL